MVQTFTTVLKSTGVVSGVKTDSDNSTYSSRARQKSAVWTVEMSAQATTARASSGVRCPAEAAAAASHSSA